MLTSIEGIYRNGRVELTEQPTDIDEGTRVIVTFIKSDQIDLVSQGINKAQAEILRSHLATFADDWESQEMNIYDDYFTLKNRDFHR
jgi:predicted DNA-binding antitoxin AbrB/MazE fold protein